MTRSEPMRTLPLAEFLRLYNDSTYHGWSGYDANDYPPCDADDVQVCFAPDDLPHDRLGRWSSYSLRGKPVSPETTVRLIRILDESVRKEPCFPDVDLLAPSPNSGYDHAHSWIHPDGYMGLDMDCGIKNPFIEELLDELGDLARLCPNLEYCHWVEQRQSQRVYKGVQGSTSALAPRVRKNGGLSAFPI